MSRGFNIYRGYRKKANRFETKATGLLPVCNDCQVENNTPDLAILDIDPWRTILFASDWPRQQTRHPASNNSQSALFVFCDKSMFLVFISSEQESKLHYKRDFFYAHPFS